MVGVVMMTVRLAVIVVAVVVMDDDNNRLTGLRYHAGPGLASRSVFITRMFIYDAVRNK